MHLYELILTLNLVSLWYLALIDSNLLHLLMEMAVEAKAFVFFNLNNTFSSHCNPLLQSLGKERGVLNQPDEIQHFLFHLKLKVDL